MMKLQWALRVLILVSLAVMLLSGCSGQEEVAKQEPAHVNTQKIAELTLQIHQDLDQITTAALKYKEEKGEDPVNGHVLKGSLETWPMPPAGVRDKSFKFEWNYYVTGTLDDMGGPTTASDTVVFLEGVTEQACYSFNKTYGGLNDKAWDFIGKQKRPDSQSWCENGGNPYRIIHVVSLR